MKKWTKCVALLGMLAICLSMMAGCVSGRNYSEEMMGNKGGLPNFYKDQEVEVPYTGGKPVEIIPTEDPVLAGLCDSEGNLVDGSGKVDLSNLGGSSNNAGNNGGNNGGTTVPDNDDQSGDETPAPDNNGNEGTGDGGDSALASDKSGTKVRLMSQNVRYNNAEDATDANKAAATRIYRLKKLIEKNDPDIIATQECDKFWVEGLPQTFGDTYSMSYQYRQSTKGSDEACAILYKKAKYDLTDSGTFWLSEDPTKSDPAGFGQYYPRIAHWAELKDKETGVKILVFSTHFGFGYTVEQMAYLRSLFAKVCGEHSDAYPFIMGDFNIEYGSENFLALNDYKDMIDLREVAMGMKSDGYCEMGDIRDGTSGAFQKDNGSSIIDFIFCQPRKNQTVDYYTFLYDRIAVEEQSIPEGPVSDHFAVLADVRVNTDVSYGDYFGDNAK